MAPIGRLLIVIGAVMALVGVLVWGLGRLGFGGLPGDIRYQGPGVRIYVPIVSSLILSLLLTAALWLWAWLRHR